MFISTIGGRKCIPFEMSQQSDTLDKFLIVSNLGKGIFKIDNATWSNRQGKGGRKM